MLVQQFQKLERYNIWAWDHVIEALGKISEDEYKKERPFFWGSLHGLLAHSLGAEIIWIERLGGNSPTKLHSAEDFDSLDEIVAQWGTIRRRWHNFLATLTEEQAAVVCHYSNTKGKVRKNRTADIIQHVFNHATEHRSQMTPILFRLDQATPTLDFIHFCVSHDDAR